MYEGKYRDIITYDDEPVEETSKQESASNQKDSKNTSTNKVKQAIGKLKTTLSLKKAIFLPISYEIEKLKSEILELTDKNQEALVQKIIENTLKDLQIKIEKPNTTDSRLLQSLTPIFQKIIKENATLTLPQYQTLLTEAKILINDAETIKIFGKISKTKPQDRLIDKTKEIIESAKSKTNRLAYANFKRLFTLPILNEHAALFDNLEEQTPEQLSENIKSVINKTQDSMSSIFDWVGGKLDTNTFLDFIDEPEAAKEILEASKDWTDIPSKFQTPFAIKKLNYKNKARQKALDLINSKVFKNSKQQFTMAQLRQLEKLDYYQIDRVAKGQTTLPIGKSIKSEQMVNICKLLVKEFKKGTDKQLQTAIEQRFENNREILGNTLSEEEYRVAKKELIESGLVSFQTLDIATINTFHFNKDEENKNQLIKVTLQSTTKVLQAWQGTKGFNYLIGLSEDTNSKLGRGAKIKSSLAVGKTNATNAYKGLSKLNLITNPSGVNRIIHNLPLHYREIIEIGDTSQIGKKATLMGEFIQDTTELRKQYPKIMQNFAENLKTMEKYVQEVTSKGFNGKLSKGATEMLKNLDIKNPKELSKIYDVYKRNASLLSSHLEEALTKSNNYLTGLKQTAKNMTHLSDTNKLIKTHGAGFGSTVRRVANWFKSIPVIGAMAGASQSFFDNADAKTTLFRAGDGALAALPIIGTIISAIDLYKGKTLLSNEQLSRGTLLTRLGISAFFDAVTILSGPVGILARLGKYANSFGSRLARNNARKLSKLGGKINFNKVPTNSFLSKTIAALPFLKPMVGAGITIGGTSLAYSLMTGVNPAQQLKSLQKVSNVVLNTAITAPRNTERVIEKHINLSLAESAVQNFIKRNITI